jgi:hypothetical protein
MKGVFSSFTRSLVVLLIIGSMGVWNFRTAEGVPCPKSCWTDTLVWWGPSGSYSKLSATVAFNGICCFCTGSHGLVARGPCIAGCCMKFGRKCCPCSACTIGCFFTANTLTCPTTPFTTHKDRCPPACHLPPVP